MRVVVERSGYDIVVRQLDNTGICSRSHVVRTIMRIPDQGIDVSHFICTIPDNATIGIVRMIVCAFSAGIAAKDANRGSEYDRVNRLSGPLSINMSPFFGCN